MLRLSTSALVGLLAKHADRPLHRIRRQDLAALEQGHELSEQTRGDRDLDRVARQRDLVAADVDVAAERPLDQPEQLVAGSQQRHHALGPGHDDERGRRRSPICHGHARC
jgi:hypothetical protein